jgi:hypothetical protein
VPLDVKRGSVHFTRWLLQVIDEIPITMVNVYGMSCIRSKPTMSTMIGERSSNVVRCVAMPTYCTAMTRIYRPQTRPAPPPHRMAFDNEVTS